MSDARRATAQEAYNRLFWDARINRDVFVVGYSDRLVPGGVREMPLVRWDPHGQIPWHRMRYLRCGDVIVWSRDAGPDRLASDDLPSAAWLADRHAPVAEVGGSDWRPRAVYRHEGDSWETAFAPGSESARSFDLATWNVLCDFGELTVPSLQRRLPALLVELAHLDAGIIALQEATPAFTRALLAQPRRGPIYLSESPGLIGLEPHGVLLLSRWPFTLLEHAGGSRPILVGTWPFGDHLVRVVNLHLPSNRSTDAPEQRRRRLEGLLTDLAHLTGDVLLVGDFNLVGDELAELLAGHGYRDVWDRLNPGEDGCTFDPLRNPLARLGSRLGQPTRFDRILWKPAESGFVPLRIARFATTAHTDAEGPLFPSDHFGLTSTWQTTGQDADPAPRSPASEYHREELSGPTEEQQTACRRVMAELDTLVAELTGRTGAVHLAGSWRLGVAGPDSDVDVVCLVPPGLPRPDFFHRLQARLIGQVTGLCHVPGARMPRLTFRRHGLSVDILAATTALERFQVRPSPGDFADAESWQAARACVEADRLLSAVEPALPVEKFRQVLRAVRTWARRRQIHGNAWGYLGGVAWAVLTAWSVLQSSRPESGASASAFLAHFFPVLTRHRWSQPIALMEAGRRYQPRGPRDRLPILRPAEPFENTAYNVTRSTARTLRAEWSRAARDPLAELFTPVDLRDESERFLVLTLTGEPAVRADLAGRVEGRIVGLLVDLERRLHLHVRPWPDVFGSEETARMVIGLPTLEPQEQHAVVALASAFLAEVVSAEGREWRVDLCDRDDARLPA